MKAMKSIWWLMLAVLTVVCASCHYPSPSLDDEALSVHERDSLLLLHEHHYTWNTNLELVEDSLALACLPVKDCYIMLHREDRVVVAEFAVHPSDSVDSVWVKLAHTQEVQGWLRESEMKRSFVPTDSISQAIYLFSRTHVVYFIAIFAAFVAMGLLRAVRRHQLQLVYFNDIDSVYPLLLCVLMAISATLYATMQEFVPETWEHFYFNPTLSPFQVPFILSLFLGSLWCFLVVLLAVLDDLFRQLSPIGAICYLLGLAVVCIFCYLFFIITTPYYVGYLFLLALLVLFVRKVLASFRTIHYTCGCCGRRISSKGTCPYCGAINR